MEEYSKMQPSVARLHDKGPGRGVAIYFGLEEMGELESIGLNLREERRFLVRTTVNKKIVLTPFFNLEQEERDYFHEIEDKVDAVLDLEKEDLEDFADELLNIIIGKRINLVDKERSSLMQFIKGHYTNFIIRNAIRVGIRADRNATQEILDQFLKIKGDG